jgi:ectoine hydroxylase-related dioxygenase (phytanoyl-CoA dioxygenase family)
MAGEKVASLKRRDLPLTDQERYLFDLQGFLVVEDALAADQLAALNAALDERLAHQVEPDASTHRFGGLFGWGPEYRALIDNPRISPYLSELLGERFRVDHEYADVIRRGKGPIGATLHGGACPFDPSQYYLFRNGRMYNGLTVVAYNLKDVNTGDGGFGCVPGSHKSNLPYPGEWRDLEQERPFVRAVIGQAGSAVIFTEALTHGTLPWHGAGERRTVFLKFCPHPLAWARSAYDGLDHETFTAEEQRRLKRPGVYPYD